VGVFVRDRSRNPAAERRFLTFVSPPIGPYTQALQDFSSGDPEGAMRTGAVWGCANKIAWSLAMMRPQPYRGQPGMAGESQKTAIPPVLADPAADADMTAFTYQSWMSLMLRGNVFGLIASRDRNGYPQQIELQHPDQCKVQLLDHDTKLQKAGEYEYKVRNEVIDPALMWHRAVFRMPGSRVGMSPIQYAAKTTRTVQAAQDFGLGFFQDGGHPSGILTNKNANKISQEQAQRVKDTFLAAVRGTREPVVMGGGWDYSQIQVSPQDSQFLDLIQAGKAEIAEYFLMKPQMMGWGAQSSGRLTYQNVEQSQLDFLTYPLTALLIQWERWLGEWLPRGQWVKLDTSPLLRTDFLSRMRGYHMMVGSRLWEDDEVRAMEDYPPLTQDQRAKIDALVQAVPPPIAGPLSGT
jgi:HK97 family phage portal protein